MLVTQVPDECSKVGRLSWCLLLVETGCLPTSDNLHMDCTDTVKPGADVMDRHVVYMLFCAFNLIAQG